MLQFHPSAKLIRHIQVLGVTCASLFLTAIPPALAQWTECDGLSLSCTMGSCSACAEEKQKCPAEYKQGLEMGGYLALGNDLSVRERCELEGETVPASTASGKSCTALADESRKLDENLRKAYENWSERESDYLSYYNASKIDLAASFDATHIELPSMVPFSNSLNSQFKVQTNQSLRHMPDVTLSINSDALSEFNAFLGLATDLKSLFGKFSISSEWVDDAMESTKDWSEWWTKGATELQLPFDEGVSTYREMMKDRQDILDNYRRSLNLYVCKSISPLERSALEIRMNDILNNGCSASEVDAMQGWLARNSRFRNEPDLTRLETYCSRYEASVKP